MTRLRDTALSILLFVAIVLIWEVAVRSLGVPRFILPPPSEIGSAFWRGVASGLYLQHAVVTLTEVALGFLLGSVFGLTLGTVIAVSERAAYFIQPYITVLQSTPKVALAPLIVLWFGLGMGSKVVSAALVSFFPLMINAITGLQSTDEDRVNLVRSLGGSKAQVFFLLRLPNALPYLLAGLEIGLTLALIGTIVAEFIGAEEGLGMLMQSMNSNLDVAGSFSVLGVLSAIGLALNQLVTRIRRRVLFWEPAQIGQAGAQEPGENKLSSALAEHGV
jgi:NitT/TauT family transport system permease protein